MGPPYSLVYVIRIFWRIHITVMGTMHLAPIQDWTLNAACASKCQKESQAWRGSEWSMWPETMVTCFHSMWWDWPCTLYDQSFRCRIIYVPAVMPTPDMMYSIPPKISVWRDSDWKKLQMKPMRGNIMQNVMLFGCKVERNLLIQWRLRLKALPVWYKTLCLAAIAKK